MQRKIEKPHIKRIRKMSKKTLRLFKSLSVFPIIHSAGVRTTKTLHLAERTIASDTEPIK